MKEYLVLYSDTLPWDPHNYDVCSVIVTAKTSRDAVKLVEDEILDENQYFLSIEELNSVPKVTCEE